MSNPYGPGSWGQSKTEDEEHNMSKNYGPGVANNVKNPEDSLEFTHVTDGHGNVSYVGPIAADENITIIQRLGKLHKELTNKAYSLWAKKSQDYGSNGDPFANFHTFGSYGILVRMFDKLSRLKSFEEKGFHAVKDESTEDTALDLINYAILYYAYRKFGGKQ